MRIAISGLTGCGNSTASDLVAAALGLKKYNYTFHDLAKDLKIPFRELHESAEKNPELDLILDNKQVQFAFENPNCVVGTRLAVFFDRVAPSLGVRKPDFDLKVWLQASEKARAARVAKRDGKTLKEALEEVRYRDASNKARYKKLYGIDYETPDGCLVVDNESLPPDETADKIIQAARKLQKA